jgi:protein TonB
MKKAEEEPFPPSLQTVEKNISVEERKVLPFENGKRAMPLVLPSDLDSRIRTDEKVLHLNEDSPKTGDLSVSLGPSHSEKSKDTRTSDIGSHEGSQIAVKLNPPLSENKIFVQPRYAENPKPVYPQEARRRGYEGEVLLKVEVLMNGRVGRVEVQKSSGYGILDRSALTAVKQWKFIPANEGNGSIPCWVNIPIKFQLR